MYCLKYYLTIGMLNFAFNDGYSFYFFQAIPPTFISLVHAVMIFVLTSIFVNSHKKNQHIHGTVGFATKKDLKNCGAVVNLFACVILRIRVRVVIVN